MTGHRNHFAGSVIGLLISSMLVAPVEGRAPKGGLGDSWKMLNPKLASALSPSSKDWVKRELVQGHSVVLSNSYLFQVIKGNAQEDQKLLERAVLIPLLEQTLRGMANATTDQNARRLFSVAVAILSVDPRMKLSEDLVKQAQEIKSIPMFKPRGHYTEAEDLQRYFVVMQYLAKATVDVSIVKEAFPFPKEMLFPFETAVAVQKVFADPANKDLVAQWMSVYSFYSEISGPSDLPTFSDLPSIASTGELTKDEVRKWAEARGLPRINPERGMGIQPLGERITVHEMVIDEMKRKFISNDTPRDKIADVLRIDKLLRGARAKGGQVRGLNERVSNGGDSYYQTVLQAISIGGKGWDKHPLRRNFFAASITSLAEQTALMAKVSMLARKAMPVEKKIPDGTKLYLEPGSEQYLLALAKGSGRMSETCKEILSKAPEEVRKRIKIRELGALFEGLAKLAQKARPLKTGDLLWKEHSHYLMELARNLAVSVDVFHVKERSGKMYYYQWAIAPFETIYSVGKGKSKPKGIEMVFFEAWNDEIVSGGEGPVNNVEWEGRILRGNLNKLHPIIRVPNDESFRKAKSSDASINRDQRRESTGRAACGCGSEKISSSLVGPHCWTNYVF